MWSNIAFDPGFPEFIVGFLGYGHFGQKTKFVVEVDISSHSTGSTNVVLHIRIPRSQLSVGAFTCSVRIPETVRFQLIHRHVLENFIAHNRARNARPSISMVCRVRTMLEHCSPSWVDGNPDVAVSRR